MGSRGRKSVSELSVATAKVVALDQRPAPPEKLNKAESEIWRRIVKRLPAGYFPAEMHGLLAEYCRVAQQPAVS